MGKRRRRIRAKLIALQLQRAQRQPSCTLVARCRRRVVRRLKAPDRLGNRHAACLAHRTEAEMEGVKLAAGRAQRTRKRHPAPVAEVVAPQLELEQPRQLAALAERVRERGRRGRTEAVVGKPKGVERRAHFWGEGVQQARDARVGEHVAGEAEATHGACRRPTSAR